MNVQTCAQCKTRPKVEGESRCELCRDFAADLARHWFLRGMPLGLAKQLWPSDR